TGTARTKATRDAKRFAPARKPGHSLSPAKSAFYAKSAFQTKPLSRAAIRRQVWQRAQGRCENCGSIYALEIDHMEASALVGGDSQENLRLLCRCCNQRSAIKQLGLPKMSIFIERRS